MHPGRSGTWGPLLGAALVASGCAVEPSRLILIYPDDVALTRARQVELYVHREASCEELVASPGALSLTFAAQGGAPNLGEVEPGRTAFLARVRDGDCQLFLEGCVQATLRAGQSTAVRVLLQATSGGGCAAGLSCSAGRCLAADAGAVDAAALDVPETDAPAIDAPMADAATSDVLTTDVSMTDAATTDAPMTDAPTADAPTTDAPAADTATADAALPDTSAPDLTPVDGGCDAGASCPACYDCVAGACEATSQLRLRQQLLISNGATVAASAGTSVRVTIDTAALIAAGTLQLDGDDLRVYHAGGASPVELDRVAERPFDATDTEIWFALAVDVPAQASDGDYFVSYGDPAAGPAPADRNAVYLFYDDFESGDLSRWQTDLDYALATDQAHSGSTSLRIGEIASDDRYAVIVGVDEADVVAEAYWRSSVAGVDVSLMVRKQAGHNNYELNLEGDDAWTIARRVDDAFQGLVSTTTPHPVDQWYKVSVIMRGTQLKVLLDDVQQAPTSGWTDVGSDFASGGVGLRAWYVGAGEHWWIDDVKVRRYLEPEPEVGLGGEEEWCP